MRIQMLVEPQIFQTLIADFNDPPAPFLPSLSFLA
jgi:hypothetical protein